MSPSLPTALVAPWADDFITSSLNYARHLGIEEIEPFLDWKLQFAENRMTDNVYCWQFATASRIIASQPGPGALFDNMADAYIPTLQYNFPNNWQAISQAECGSQAMADAVFADGSVGGFGHAGNFAGYNTHPIGYPAGFRPVLAAAKELNQPWANLAWDRLVNAPNQPAWTQYPSFAILPRD